MIDHNRLGRELGLSCSDPLVGAGLPIWLPAGAAVRHAVEEYLLIFRSRGRSYRELPLRIAELGGQYRAERSGVLGGLSRVRAIHRNDAHVFCAPEQLTGEIAGALRLVDRAHRARPDPLPRGGRGPGGGRRRGVAAAARRWQPAGDAGGRGAPADQ